MLDLKNKHLIFGLTGGIACYKIAELVRRAKDHGATIDVVMTSAAEHHYTSDHAKYLSAPCLQ